MSKASPYPLFEFLVGKVEHKDVDLFWDPDSETLPNPHALLCAQSGAGKTTLLLKLAAYLTARGKHIFLLDLKGDMLVYDDNGVLVGNYLDLNAWGSEYGLNPLEFDTGVNPDELQEILANGGIKAATEKQKKQMQNSGPKVQVERLTEIFKKNFHQNMGPKQEVAFKFIFEDTYISKGFVYNDISTWNNELPSLEDTIEIIEKLKLYMNGTRLSVDLLSLNYTNQIQELLIKMRFVKEERKIRDAAMKGEAIVAKKDQGIILEEYAGDVVEEEGKRKRKRKIVTRTEIEDFIDAVSSMSTDYLNSLANSLEKDFDEVTETYYREMDTKYAGMSIEDASLKSWFKSKNINIQKYMPKDIMRAVEQVGIYIDALKKSELFHDTVLPIKAGLNVINISGLEVQIQKFIADIILGKVFKACKIRGEYKNRSKKERERGAKVNTFFMIDESKLIAGSQSEKNNPYSYLNRIATEARSYGLGIIVAAQSAEHYPSEFVKNFATQILLDTSIADFEAVKKSFGLTKEELSFTQMRRGNALFKKGRLFERVRIPYRPSQAELDEQAEIDRLKAS